MINDTVTLTQELIRCPSVTPKDEGAQELLAGLLEPAGFEIHHLPFGEGTESVPNLFARYGTDRPHLCFAGHTDVVPPGPEDKWTVPPFSGEIKDGLLYGRGTSDMKGGVAAFTIAALNYLKKQKNFKGSISFLITGDEEGRAIHGTQPVLKWMDSHGHIPDATLVGEPTNPEYLGQEIKPGRRGSLTGLLTVHGKQGHVAFQHLADNPLPRLIKLLDALCGFQFDTGTETFTPTNLEVTTIDVGNPATNVIPGHGKATFNIRFNDNWDKDTLETKVREILDSVSTDYDLEVRSNTKCFLTKPGKFLDIVTRAVQDVTDKTPKTSTTGGTSDARFISEYCDVLEFGLINKTIHQIDEHTKVEDLEQLTKIYERLLGLYFES